MTRRSIGLDRPTTQFLNFTWRQSCTIMTAIQYIAALSQRCLLFSSCCSLHMLRGDSDSFQFTANQHRGHTISSRSVASTCSEILPANARTALSAGMELGRDSNGVPAHFQPEICRFRHKIRIPKEEILQCIRQEILYYVVFAGDSNSMRYFDAFRALLAGVGAHCVPTQVCSLLRFSCRGAIFREKRVSGLCQSSHISKPQSNLRQLFMHACCSWLRIGSPLTLYFRFGMTSYLRTMSCKYDS